MKNGKMVIAVAVSIFMLAAVGYASATDDAGAVKQDMKQDKAAIVAKHAEIKTNAMNAKSEEKTLKDQIKAAKQSGGKEQAKTLRSQLKSTHQGNVAERRQDKKDLGAIKKDMKQDRRAARQGPPPAAK